MVRYEQKYKRQRGAAILIVVLFFTAISTIIVTGYTATLLREYHTSKGVLESTQVYYVAEAGIEDVYYRLKNSTTLSSTESLKLDGITSTTTLTNLGAGSWSLQGVAERDVYTRKVDMEASNTITNADFPYGAQVGEGGIDMYSATIQGTGGSKADVFSNGSVIGSVDSTITGNITVSTGITEDISERSVVCDVDQEVGRTDPDIDLAQSFTASASSTLAKVSLYLKKNTNPGNKPVYIVADNGGVPATTYLAEGELTASLVGTDYAWIDVVFPTPPSLVAGETYWIVIDSSSHPSRYYLWCGDSAAGYIGGSAAASEDRYNDPWNTHTHDLTFKIFFGEGFSEVQEVDVSGTVKANTITDSTIGEDAHYQNISGTTVYGTSYPGSSDPSVVPMPLSDANIASWKTAAEAGGTINGDCPSDPGCSLSMGPVKIDGDLTIVGGETLTLTGVTHVTGDVYPENNTRIECDLSFGDQSCILLVDGNVDISNNTTFSGSGDPDSFILTISTIEGCEGVADPSCAPQGSGIFVMNNATGVIFYTTDSLVYLNNNVEVTTVVAYKLHLSNGVIVTYDTDLEDLNFSSGPDGGWQINDWREVE